MTEKPKVFVDSFHNPPYAPYKWLDAGFIHVEPTTFAPIKTSLQTNSPHPANMFLKVAKPIRLVYEQNGQRYHLTLGENELPLDVTLTAVNIYSTQWNLAKWNISQPDIFEEIEITLKMRVKNYTIKKIETE